MLPRLDIDSTVYIFTFYVHVRYFYIDPSTTLIYTLSLHDALPISTYRWSLPADTRPLAELIGALERDRKSTRLNSSHVEISYAVFCLKKNNIDVALLLTLHKTFLLFMSLLVRFMVNDVLH